MKKSTEHTLNIINETKSAINKLQYEQDRLYEDLKINLHNMFDKEDGWLFDYIFNCPDSESQYCELSLNNIIETLEK